MDDADRQHFARIAAATKEENRRRRALLDAESPLSRVVRGLLMAQPFVGIDPVIEARVERRRAAKGDLHRIWRERQARR